MVIRERIVFIGNLSSAGFELRFVVVPIYWQLKSRRSDRVLRPYLTFRNYFFLGLSSAKAAMPSKPRPIMDGSGTPTKKPLKPPKARSSGARDQASRSDR